MDPGATTILLFLADLIAGTQRYGKLDDRITNGQGLVVRSLAQNSRVRQVFGRTGPS